MTTALLIIDMQNAYFEDTSLAEERPRMVAECNRLTAGARAAGSPVLLICTEHQRDKSTWTLSMLDDNQGFIFSGTRQSEPVQGLDTLGLPRLVKTRDSAFFGTDLLPRLRNCNVETLVLAGAATQNCVAQTAADAFANNLRVIHASDATGSNNPDDAEAVLGVISKEYRQPVLATAEILPLF